MTAAPTSHITVVEMTDIAVPTVAIIVTVPIIVTTAVIVAVSVGRHGHHGHQSGKGKHPAYRLGHLHLHFRFLKVWLSILATSLQPGVKITERAPAQHVISVTA
jgi:hypothetical protein